MEENYETYEKIFRHGHLTFYKNDQFSREFFRLETGSFIKFPYVVSTNYCCHFDELNEWQKVFIERGYSVFDMITFSDINYRYYRFVLAQKEVPEYDAPQIFLWEAGRLYRYYINDGIKISEISYLHLQKRSMKIVGKLDYTKPIVIVPNQIFNIDKSEITERFIVDNSPKKIIWKDYAKKQLKIYFEKLMQGGMVFQFKKSMYKFKCKYKVLKM